MAYEVEHTDTDGVGGSANGCWVNRYEIEDRKMGWTDLALVRRAKALTGLTGVRCDVTNLGDYIEIRPRGMCQVVCVAWVYE